MGGFFSAPKMPDPTPPPPPPPVDDNAAVEEARRKEREAANKRKGRLSTKIADPDDLGAANTQKRTLLGA